MRISDWSSDVCSSDLTGYEDGEIDTIMLENRFQLQPIGDFGTATDVGQVGQNHLLVQWAHNHIRAEALGVAVYLGLKLAFGKIKPLVQHFKPAVVELHDALADRIGEVNKVDFPGVYLRKEE